MNTIKYTCEVVTPMFLNGADGVNPELRGPSIKGGMRFWFRAVNGHLSLEELSALEAKLFGDTKGRSNLRIRISWPDELVLSNYALLPHRQVTGRNSSRALAIAPGQKFHITLSFPQLLTEAYDGLFQLFSILGGMGKRSRRGMGSFRIKEILFDNDLNSILLNVDLIKISGLIKTISPYSNYVTSERAINNNFGGRKELYPWIKEVQLGSQGEDDFEILLRKIGLNTSAFKLQDVHSYEASMGHANRGRFASPIYVSIIKKDSLYIPIISTLNTVPDRGRQYIDRALQEEFKNRLL